MLSKKVQLFTTDDFQVVVLTYFLSATVADSANRRQMQVFSFSFIKSASKGKSLGNTKGTTRLVQLCTWTASAYGESACISLPTVSILLCQILIRTEPILTPSAAFWGLAYTAGTVSSHPRCCNKNAVVRRKKGPFIKESMTRYKMERLGTNTVCPAKKVDGWRTLVCRGLEEHATVSWSSVNYLFMIQAVRCHCRGILS